PVEQVAEEETAPEPAEPAAPAIARIKPPVLTAPRNGAADDFTLIEDVAPIQQAALYALGVFHYDQIAAWTPEHVAWIDHYFRLRGRREAEDWIEQARALAREGVAAARRVMEDQDA